MLHVSPHPARDADVPIEIRPARSNDLDALVTLEQACWPAPLCADREALAARLQRYPDGQWVLQYGTRVVGAIYGQRIDDVTALYRHNHRNVHALHRAGAPIAQLLAVNVLPEVRPLGFGDRLLEHALQRCREAEDVREVAAVSICRDFQGGGSVADYIAAVDEHGLVVDPILRFHQLHGADIVGPVRGYRPEDLKNQGCGVLVRYDLTNASETTATPAPSVTDRNSLRHLIETAIRAQLEERGAGPYQAKRALMDLGLDSLDLYGLRKRLETALGKTLHTDLFFRAPSGAALIDHFNREMFGAETHTPTTTPLPEQTIEATTDDNASGYAIIGLACRFPGAADLEAFRDLLNEGRDGLREVPPSRWSHASFASNQPQAAGKIACARGGFLDNVAAFDAALFGISPREAHRTDPQQRMLLEVSRTALEHAGTAPGVLHGSNAAFYVGAFSHDYEYLQLRQNRVTDYDPYFGTGNAASMCAGRLAYVYGSQGPAMTVDTACSSSLTAVHLACQALANGETDLAVAAGVNLMLSPELSLSFSRAGMLSPNGRCATFDAAADGYVRGEGCAAVVLKRVADARRDGDPIHAVIRGTAVNHDGPANGLTAPNGQAQEAVIRAALSQAGIDGNTIDYVETHGTGTPLGDAVELRALHQVFTADDADRRPLRIGSVKTNIGHTEAAAGLAGLIKTVIALQQDTIPPHLHYQTPNREVDLTHLPLKVTAAAEPWPSGQERPRRAGVSSFGFSGTNAHIIVEAAPGPSRSQADGEHHLITLSARTPAALTKQQQQLQRYLEHHPQANLADLEATLALGRDHQSRRRAWVADHRDDLLDQLKDTADLNLADDLGDPGIVMMFSGQGAQYAGMAHGLYQREAVFREVVDTCNRLSQTLLDQPLKNVLFDSDPATSALVNQTAYTQPCLFAVEVGMARLWQHWGLQPRAVLGHSIGEYAAAHLAGVFSLEDGFTLIAARGRLMQALEKRGTMAAILTDAAAVNAVRDRLGQTFDIAAHNGPTNTVISGPTEAVNAALETFSTQGVRCVQLTVSHAFHSRLMDPMLEAFAEVAATIRYQTPRLTLYSNLSGRPVDDAVASADYWVHHVREPVRFQQTIHKLAEDADHHFLLEVGPKPVLTGMARRCLGSDHAVTCLGGLVPGDDDRRAMLASLAQLYMAGLDLNMDHVLDQSQGQRRPLPTTVFDRQNYWLPEHRGRAPRDWSAHLGQDHHPFLGEKLDTPLATTLFSGQIDTTQHTWLGDHRLGERILLPGAAMITAALDGLAGSSQALHDLQFEQPLFLDEQPRAVQNHFSDSRHWSFYAKDPDSDAWIKHACARCDGTPDPQPSSINLQDTLAALPYRQDQADLYPAVITADTLHFGPAFQGVTALHSAEHNGGKQALAHIVLPSAQGPANHATLLDSCLQAAAFCINTPAEHHQPPYLLMGIDAISAYGPIRGELWSQVNLAPNDEALPGFRRADVTLYNEAGAAVLHCRGLLFKRAAHSGADTDAQNVLYQTSFHPFMPRGLHAATAAFSPLSSLLQIPGADTSHEPPQALGLLENLSVAYIQRALGELGLNAIGDHPLTIEDIMDRLGIKAEHTRLTGRLLEILAEVDLAHAAGRTWRLDPLPAVDLDTCRAAQSEIDTRFPELTTESALLARCGEALAEVLTGQRDALDLIFPDADLTTAIELYERSPTFAPQNRNLAAMVEKLVPSLPADRPLRILEIGAGTGGTSAHIVPLLGSRCAEYVFTDITPFFSQRVTQRFSAYPFVSFQVLNLEQDPVEQGFQPESFDLVVAANVVHATRDIQASLTQARNLLAPGGLLLLLEGTLRRRWIDLIFGLTDGWWRFHDTELRRNYPLITGEAWLQTLKKQGFSRIEEGTPAAGGTALFPQSVFVAQRATAAESPTQRRHWWVLADRGGLGGRVARDLRQAGHKVDLVSLGDGFAENGEGFLLDPCGAQNLSAMWRELQPPDAIAVVWGLDLPDRFEAGTHVVQRTTTLLNQGLLYLVQSILKQTEQTPQLRLVTAGAISDGETPGSPSQSTLWGFASVLHREHPEFDCRLLDMPYGFGERPTAPVITWLTGSLQHPEHWPRETLYREQGWHTCRLQHLPGPPIQEAACDAEAVYLITGGLGGTGLLSAQHLVGAGARRLILTGRSAPTTAAAQQIATWQEQGVTVYTRRFDVADYEQVEQCMSWCDGLPHPLKGVIHAAGTYEDRLLANHEWSCFEKVFAAKVDGAWNLHLATRERRLDFFVLYASAMTVLPTAGLSNYTAANRFLDGLAALRRAHGLPGISVAWGPWSGIGMASAVGRERQEQWRRFGLTPLSPEQALSVLSACLADPAGEPQLPAAVAAVTVDWSAFAAHHHGNTPAFYQDVTAALTHGGTRQTVTADLRQNLAALPPEQQPAFLEKAVRELAAAVMGHSDPAQINPKLGLFQQGLDSLSSMELRARLQQHIGATLSTTVLFKYPSIQALAAHLLQSLKPAVTEPSEAPAESGALAVSVPADLDDDSSLEDELAALENLLEA